MYPRDLAGSQQNHDRNKKLTSDGGKYVEPSLPFYWDLSQKIGLSPADTADWTPGMLLDLVFYKANKTEEKKQAEARPSQTYFDDF